MYIETIVNHSFHNKCLVSAYCSPEPLLSAQSTEKSNPVTSHFFGASPGRAGDNMNICVNVEIKIARNAVKKAISL